MSRTVKLVTLTSLMLAAAIGVSAEQSSAHDHEMKMGKKGDFMFDTAMQVGAVTLPAGHYRFQHRVDGDEHYVLFTALEGKHDSFTGTEHAPSGAKDIGEVKCRVERLSAKAKITRIHWAKRDGGGRINRIEVKGETVAHVF